MGRARGREEGLEAAGNWYSNRMGGARGGAGSCRRSRGPRGQAQGRGCRRGRRGKVKKKKEKG
jgi:hypothetical protein